MVVAAYAVAMAWVESAVVYYIRLMIHRIEPYQPNPLPIFGGLGFAEGVRELATMAMLATVGILAGGGARSRLGYSLIAFGIWDIFYYVFLKVLTDWPHSVMDWDVLFLLPLPWWGPLLAPVLISLLMIGFGTLATRWERSEPPLWPGWKSGLVSLAGILLALYVFMTDSIQAVRGGKVSIRDVLPVSFNWPLFLVALACMGWPLWEMLGQLWGRYRFYLSDANETSESHGN